MNPTIIEQIGKASTKAFFLYSLHTNRFDFLSQAAASIWELELPCILDAPGLLAAAIHPGDREAVDTFAGMLRNGAAKECEFRLQLPGGALKKVKLDAYPITDITGVVWAVAGTAEDITGQAQYLEYLVEFASRKDSALEIIAHDLRGPLSLMKSVSYLLESEHREQKYEQVSTYVKIIQDAYDACSNLINDLLSDEHLRSPTIYVKKERVDAVQIVQQTVATYRKAGNVKLAIEVISAADTIMTPLDKVKFMQIMNNLLSNSIKFTRPGGKVTITLQQEGRFLLLTHADNGVGIPRQLQPYLFDRYSKASRQGLNGEKSNGIGLAIVRDLVEIQGGKVWFESEEHAGTTFYLSFPMQE